MYIGFQYLQVLEVDAVNKDIKVCYLRQTGGAESDVYCLSQEEDSWHHNSDIIGCIGQPEIHGTGSRIKFSFKHSHLQVLKAKCSEL